MVTIEVLFTFMAESDWQGRGKTMLFIIFEVTLSINSLHQFFVYFNIFFVLIFMQWNYRRIFKIVWLPDTK